MPVHSYRRRFTFALIAAASLAGCAGAYAQTDDGDEIAIPGGRAVHGIVLAGGTADHLSLRDSTGAGTVQVMVNPSTRIRRSRAPIHLSEIRPGETVFAFGTLDETAHTLHALVVGVLDSADLKRAEEDLGKTYITGTVVSIHELHLVIRRPDGLEQTIAVDESTSFRRGRRRSGPGGGGQPSTARADTPASGFNAGAEEGESITLADVHTGSTILASGALQHGVFVPAVLRVLSPMGTSNSARPRTGGSPERPR